MTNAKDLRDEGTRAPRTPKKILLTKVVCRRLPPTMEKESFLELVSPLPEYNYFRFEKPNPEDGNVCFCRAYFNFIHEEDVFNFTERFDGYVFLDKQGNEYPAIVEFSPYQKIPKNTGEQRQDSKCNTLDTDKEYLAFLEAYENKENENSAHPTPEQYLEEIEKRDKNKETSTPLLEFLALRKSGKKGKFRERKARRQRMGESGHKQEKVWRDKNDPKEPAEPGEETERKKKRNEDDRRSRRGREDKKHATHDSKEEGGGRNNFGDESSEKSRRQNREENAKKEESSESTRRSGREDKASEGKEDSHHPKRFSDRRRGDRSRKQHKESSDSFQSQPITLLKKDDFPAIGGSVSKDHEPEVTTTPKQKTKKSGDRIKNKERPAIQIYRPGMGKFSSQTIKADSQKQEEGGRQEESQETAGTTCKGKSTKIYYNRNSARRSERIENAD